MKKRFTLTELLVLIAIIAVSLPIFISFFTTGSKEEVVKTETSSKASKFSRLDQAAVAFKPEEVEPTMEQSCEGIDNEEAKGQCENAYRNDRGIEECIKRYQQ